MWYLLWRRRSRKNVCDHETNRNLTCSSSCRSSTRKQGRKKPAVLCTTSCLRLWRRSVLRRLLSCRARYTHPLFTHLHAQFVRQWTVNCHEAADCPDVIQWQIWDLHSAHSLSCIIQTARSSNWVQSSLFKEVMNEPVILCFEDTGLNVVDIFNAVCSWYSNILSALSRWGTEIFM